MPFIYTEEKRVEPAHMAENTRPLSRKLLIVNELGLHARSAAQIAMAARRARGRVWLQKEKEERVDAKQIIDILTLASAKGDSVTVGIEAESDFDTLDRIAALFADGFGE